MLDISAGPTGTLRIAMAVNDIMMIITMTFVMTSHDSFMNEVPPGFQSRERHLLRIRIQFSPFKVPVGFHGLSPKTISSEFGKKEKGRITPSLSESRHIWTYFVSSAVSVQSFL